MSRRRGTAAIVVAALLSVCVVVPARSAGGALALGDSITVGAAAQLRAAGYEVDAEVGRSFAQGLAILRARASSLPDRILLNLGTNSGVTAAQCDQLLSIVGTGRALTLVTVNIPAAPAIAAASNSVLASCASRGGAALADWAGYVAAHPGAVCSDGIHISCGSAGEYARFVLSRAAGAPQAADTASPPAGTAVGRTPGSSQAAQAAEAAQEAQAARLARQRAAARAAEAARLAAQRRARLDYLHSIGGPPTAVAPSAASYEFVPVSVRLSLLASS